MTIKYKVVDEWSAPTYYEHDTHEVLYDECNASIQGWWVVSYDEDEQEVVEWLERFDDAEKAVAWAKELNDKLNKEKGE